jgi:multidrug efflux pump subunit AcrA (membrane-fusion protein)
VRRTRSLHFAVALLACGFAAAASAQSPKEITLDSVVLRPIVEAETPARQVGVLDRIVVAEGATVAAGDVLAALDDRTAKLAVQKAELERDQAQAKVENDLRIQYADKALDVARAEMQRSIESNGQFANSISQSQLDVERLTVEKLELERKQAQRDMESDRFDLQLKETALAAAQLELELHSVRAPFAGVVALVRGRVGEWVQPGAPVLRLVAVDVLRAEGFAPASAVDGLAVGATVRFTPGNEAERDPAERRGGEKRAATTPLEDSGRATPTEFVGKVGFISPETDPVTHQIRLWAEIDNHDHRLRPGQQGQLHISPRAVGEAK